jgi:hypothetical protein
LHGATPVTPDRPTVPLAPAEVAALLHESPAEAERDAATVELLPLGEPIAEPVEEPPPEPARLARGSDQVAPAKPRRTVEKLRVDDITGPIKKST